MLKFVFRASLRFCAPPELKATRRWYYFIPAAGAPRGLVHRIEPHSLDTLPGGKRHYSEWTEQVQEIRRLLAGAHTVAMQYSALCAVPYVSMVDGGTIELVRSANVEIRTSADLVQLFEASWSEQQVANLLDGGTREVPLTTRIPVHMTYFTAMVDRQGSLQTFGDLYGLDARMGAILFGTKVPFVTPRYDDEIKAMRTRHRPAGPTGASTLADALASIFSP